MPVEGHPSRGKLLSQRLFPSMSEAVKAPESFPAVSGLRNRRRPSSCETCAREEQRTAYVAVRVFPIHFMGPAMNEEEHRQLARKLIRQLLASGPMKGATLKLRMLAAFEAEAQTSFDAAFRIYPKFASFLAANDDLVEITRPPATLPGDITVCLRQASDAVGPAGDDFAPKDVSDFAMPREIWQAFTNPDVHRRRYFQKSTGSVVHFLDSALPPTVLDPDDWVRITPIPPDAQSGWMYRFVETNFASSAKQVELRQVASLPYTSALNHTFASILGAHAAAWKRYRASRVVAAVRKWAEDNGISIEAVAKTASRAPVLEPEAPRDALRAVLLEVIKSASADELRLIQMPASLLLSFSRPNAR